MLWNLIFVVETSSNILLPCNVDADCEAIVKDSTCSLVLGKHCTCPAGFTISSDVSSCIKGKNCGGEVKEVGGQMRGCGFDCIASRKTQFLSASFNRLCRSVLWWKVWRSDSVLSYAVSYWLHLISDATFNSVILSVLELSAMEFVNALTVSLTWKVVVESLGIWTSHVLTWVTRPIWWRFSWPTLDTYFRKLIASLDTTVSRWSVEMGNASVLKVFIKDSQMFVGGNQ